MKFHFYKVEIESRYIYRLLNNTGNIKLRNIKVGEETAEFMVDYGDYHELKCILDENKIKLTGIEEKGIYVKVINFPVIKITVAVLAIFILLMTVNSLFIWKISVDGNYSYTDNQIINFVHSKNIREGITKEKVVCDSLEKEIRKNFEDISWVCVEIKGTNLIVHVKENYITEISVQEDEPYNIVANKEGKIMSILVRKGKALVKAGDTVREGDTLISGIVDVFDESGQKLFHNLCNADGDIVARTVYKYEDSLKIKHAVKKITDRKNYYLPSFFGYQWIRADKKNNKDVVLSERTLKFFGNYYLPISMQEYTVKKYEIVTAEYTKEQAESILNQKLLDNLAIMEQKGYKIVKKNVRIEKVTDSYVLEGKITCNEPLGKVSYIDINEIEEGTTTVNERD